MTTLTQRYQPGGDIYATFLAKYGAGGADRIAAAAVESERTGDKSIIGDAIGREQYGAPLETSTIKIFGQQIYNEPLTAPLEQISKVTENTVKTVFSFSNWGLWILVALGLGYVFLSRK